MTDEDVVMKAGNAILQNAIVTGVPATLYTDWNAVKLLYTDIFDQILSTGRVPSDAFLQQKQAALEALKVKE
ncbi:MAG: hypothetical protein EOM48_07570 [Bacilli bacterium]|nr:hypothetical protein [Bacilli bacterium]